MMPPVRRTLRDLTRPAHERTDAAFSSLDLARRADYRVFLASHLLAYRALEPVFAARLDGAARPPVMSGLLSEDLAALGDTARETPPAFTGDALGAAYVIGGSHFGKRVLLRRWSRSEDGQVRAAGRYLASPALADYWPALRGALEAVPGDALPRLAEGASAAFTLFETCLDRVRRTPADAPA